jgi:hypothetical protein
MALAPRTADKTTDKAPASDSFPVEKPLAPKIKAGDHPNPSTMRQDVAGKPQEDLSADIDSARTPYPVGSPPDPEDIFEEQHGYRKGS